MTTAKILKILEKELHPYLYSRLKLNLVVSVTQMCMTINDIIEQHNCSDERADYICDLLESLIKQTINKKSYVGHRANRILNKLRKYVDSNNMEILEKNINSKKKLDKVISAISFHYGTIADFEQDSSNAPKLYENKIAIDTLLEELRKL